ncbi:flavin-containing monooxygenase [Pseudodonghicola flavimaris]|uniref:NAD(P)/FAD-dependent oxidoreductase n=1 Tax=Pseudodonghicola flavimaris TaxID=3050036 RepID=A0ABT7F2Z3_9RHOB|nr:NAD(P)/FAD-dependent oxidoreductase [Pseudodonghicola flavimaris]MDK3018945.1 NAD(P)/FAD-dependent oxidoreductase [Pseudodonghicola flavimaris]
MSDALRCELLIVGAGFSGLIMALEARRQGITDIVILEKASDIGGTWRDNVYPGVACDIPSHLYSMARRPNPDWSRSYAPGPEIQSYLQGVARTDGLYDLCRFGQELSAARWDGRLWQVETKTGDRFAAPVLCLALGALHLPLIPKVPGAKSFPGPSFHSARWDQSVDFAGKRVAVIGSGASAVQFLPEVARQAHHVTLFQRSAPYVLPRADRPITPRLRALHRRWPWTRRVRRWWLFHSFEARHMVFRGRPMAVRKAMKMWRRTLEKTIADPQLRADLTPPYRIGCKRILSSNAWYPALARDNVTVIPAGLSRIEGHRLIAETGATAEADVLIWGTGFHVTDALRGLRITGRDGQSLARRWLRGLEAHLGLAVSGFPNLFFLLGPHSGLGHNSVVLMIEAQAEHIARLISAMRENALPAVEPRAEAQEAFETEMDDRLAATVWQAGGCSSWYQDRRGRNTTLWPGTVAEYRKRLARAGLDHYIPAPPPP